MIVEISNLEVVYDGGAGSLKVLDVPEWTVHRGEQVALFGASGSGKSTLLHVISGLLPATSGRVSICGEEISSMGEAARDHFRARHIGYIFQSFNLLEGYTAVENVLLGMTFSGAKPDHGFAADILSELGLGDRLNHRPSQLSFGQQQRVAAARSLANKPELILADEPTGSLDPRRAQDVLGHLRGICKQHGCTLILVSHEAAIIEQFEQSVPFLELNRAFARDGGSL